MRIEVAINQLRVCATEPAMPSMDCCNTVLSEVERLRAEVERLQFYKDNIENATKSSMDESCDALEVHCTCVPLLRVEIERLQAIVDKLPTTVDGVTIVPGMEVFFRCGACDGAVESMVPVNGIGNRLSGTFYNTREAAEAAGGE